MKDLREMTPRKQEFASRNKNYYEAISINKLCKQYHSLKRNNYSPNSEYLKEYRMKIKQLLKNISLYNLFYWSIKQRYQTHKKYEIINATYNICNPIKNWNVNDSNVSELLLSNEKRTILFKLKEDSKLKKDENIEEIPQIKKDEIEFEFLITNFTIKKGKQINIHQLIWEIKITTKITTKYTT